MKKMKSLRVILKTSLLAGMMLVVSCQQYGILHEIDKDAARSNAYIE